MRKTGTAAAAAVLSLTFMAVTQPLPARADCGIPATRDLAITRTVHQVGSSLGVSGKVMLAGFAAGWVESHMNNLPCGDLDSLGVFQQRPSQGWGTPEQIMNPTYAATAFFTRAKQSEARNPGQTAAEIAQDVQKSGPNEYWKYIDKAQQLLDEAGAQSAGKVYDNIRFASDGSWQGARVADNGSISQTAVTRGADGSMHMFTLAGGKVYHNIRNASGSWQGPAVADNGPVSQVAVASTWNGDVHMFTLAGGTVYHNIRFGNNGSWQGPAVADNGGAVSQIAAAGGGGAEVHLLTLAGGKVYHNIRFGNGSWQGPAVADNGPVSQVAATGALGGNVHLLTLAGGTVYHNIRYANTGSWQGPRVADNGPVDQVAIAGTPDGSVHVATLAGGKVYHRLRDVLGDWQEPRVADGSGRVLQIALAGLSNSDLHLDTIA